MVIDDFHLFNLAPNGDKGRSGIWDQHERVGMHHILGGEFAKAVVELYPLAQKEGPFFHVRAGLPLFRQAGDELSRLGVDVEQGLQKGVKL